MSESMKTAIYAGSFDPMTAGHHSVARRALAIADKLVIAISANAAKRDFLSPEQRASLIRRAFADDSRVEVVINTGLTAELAREMGASCLVRGVRSVADFESEMIQAQVNKDLSGLDTILLFTEPQHAHLSSSIVRELIKYGRNVDRMLPQGITTEQILKMRQENAINTKE